MGASLDYGDGDSVPLEAPSANGPLGCGAAGLICLTILVGGTGIVRALGGAA